jgi:hypothetical protein
MRGGRVNIARLLIAPGLDDCEVVRPRSVLEDIETQAARLGATVRHQLFQ